MDIDIKEIIKTATEGLDLSKFKGDVVGVKIVENEIGNVEAGGIGVKKVYGKDVQDNDKFQQSPEGIVSNQEEENEERFHFIHPEIEDDEAWRIHKAIKRLVAHQRAKEICNYLSELKKERKLLLPESSDIMYNELERMGMPTGDGYSKKYFSSCYKK